MFQTADVELINHNLHWAEIALKRNLQAAMQPQHVEWPIGLDNYDRGSCLPTV